MILCATGYCRDPEVYHGVMWLTSVVSVSSTYSGEQNMNSTSADRIN